MREALCDAEALVTVTATLRVADLPNDLEAVRVMVGGGVCDGDGVLFERLAVANVPDSVSEPLSESDGDQPDDDGEIVMGAVTVMSRRQMEVLKENA